MIKKTRMKFTIIIVVSLIALLAALLINLNLTMDQTKARNFNETLDSLVSNYGQKIPSKITNSNEFFIINVNHKNDIIDVVYGQEALSEEELTDFKDKVMLLKLKRGDFGNYKFLIQKTYSGHIMAFVNTESENLMLKELKDRSIRIAIVGFVFILILSYGFSKIITKPLETAMKKQKTFVSDASHELKTPLSIIKINSDLLKSRPKDLEYLNEIDMQIDRMSNLINDLLALAQLENHNQVVEFKEFDLSKTILHSILQLEVIAFENNREIKYQIEEKLVYKGIEKDMRTMVDALIDNAIKYSFENSDIVVDFGLKGKHRILTISNQSIEISQEDCLNIFDGFYRMDQSRSSHSTGFGIGLSIVKNIALKHGGTAKANYKEGLFTIKVTL
jgi:signal transduction histidine kinase